MLASLIAIYVVQESSMPYTKAIFDFLLIITHIALVDAKIPASVSSFYQYLFEIAKFDPLPSGSIYDNILGFTELVPI